MANPGGVDCISCVFKDRHKASSISVTFFGVNPVARITKLGKPSLRDTPRLTLVSSYSNRNPSTAGDRKLLRLYQNIERVF